MPAEPGAQPYRRRTADSSIGARMTVVERDLYHLGIRMDEHLQASKEGHEKIGAILERLDARDDALDLRVDKIDLRLAAVGGVIALSAFAAQLLAPALQRILGLPS